MIPPEVIPPLVFADSKDFTKDEAVYAEAVATPQAMIDSARSLECLFCKKRLGIKEQSFKRHAGVHYSKVKLACEEGHVEIKVFRLDWLTGGNPGQVGTT
jgi:hypothetical protein